MKKIMVVVSIISLIFILIGCENAHIKAQFKENSQWISEDEKISIFFKGPITKKAFGSIEINQINEDVIFELSEYNDKLYVFTLSSLANEEPVITFDLKVVIEDKKFLKDKVTALVSLNHSNDINYDEYKIILNRTTISNDEIFAKDFIGLNYVSSEFGMKIEYSDQLFFNREFNILINDRPRNIYAIFKFVDNNIFEIIKDNELLLTGVYNYEEEKLILRFGTNNLYHDTNEIILEQYT